MTGSAAALREPWESLADQARVARFGMWAFIASEVLFFGAVFMAYTFVRTLHPAAFVAAARETNLWFGGANTAILITSSFTMVMAAKAANLDLRRMATLCLTITALLGVAFLVVKGFEYREDVHDHLVPGQNFKLSEPATQIFFSFYWGITGIHALHLTIGIALVGRLAWLLWRERLPTQSPQIDVTSLYWGFVDMVWIVVFPLIYLGGARG
jgi:cytochrome c oxidase subunit III